MIYTVVSTVSRHWKWAAAGAALLALLLGGWFVWHTYFAAPAGVTGQVSGITPRLRSRIGEGQRRDVFTLVGDSISASSAFLKPFGAGDYDLGEYGALADTIRFFDRPNARGENPFAASSVAVHVGWTSADVLHPAAADARLCRPDESPLACEYRLRRPAVALILIGTNDVTAGRTVEDFRHNLRQIVAFSLEQGVIPVLSTLPPLPLLPSEDRVAAFNATIRATARDYDVPLMDYWAALQPIPGYGISADGVHPTTPPDGRSAYFDAEHLQYGYTVRNLLALDALDMLRRAVLE